MVPSVLSNPPNYTNYKPPSAKCFNCQKELIIKRGSRYFGDIIKVPVVRPVGWAEKLHCLACARLSPNWCRYHGEARLLLGPEKTACLKCLRDTKTIVLELKRCLPLEQFARLEKWNRDFIYPDTHDPIRLIIPRIIAGATRETGLSDEILWKIIMAAQSVNIIMPRDP